MEEKTQKYSLNISSKADNNLEEIFLYISEVRYEPLNAARIIETIIDLIFDEIAESPMVFPECRFIPTKRKIYRQALCKGYYIVFKVIKNEILILGIIHHARHPKHVRALRRKSRNI